MIKVGIFFGGKSREREISFAGGRTVFDNLNKSLFEPVPIFIDSLGRLTLLNWENLYKGTIRDFFPGAQVNYASRPFQVYADSLANMPEAEYEKLQHEIGKPLNWEDLSNLIDLAFLALHGPYGEDGSIQGILEWFGIPYTGSGIFASAFGINKVRQRRLFESLGWKGPKFTILSRDDIQTPQDWENAFSKVQQVVGFPCVVKAPHQGSSIGVSVVQKAEIQGFKKALYKSFFIETITKEEWLAKNELQQIDWVNQLVDVRTGVGLPLYLSDAKSRTKIFQPEELIEKLQQTGWQQLQLEPLDSEQEVLIESFIPGKEFSCIVIEGLDGEPIALPPTEIIKSSQLFDYRAKYLPGISRKVTPIDVPLDQLQAIKVACEAMFKTFQFNVYARLDGFIQPDGGVVLNDPNTTSGMLPSSFFFHQAAEIGLNPSQFLTYVIYASLRSGLKNGKNRNRQMQMLQDLKAEIESQQKLTARKIKVGVIMGGYSSERHISMESGRNIFEKLSSSVKYQPIPLFLTGSEQEFRLYKLPVKMMLKDNADDIRHLVEHPAALHFYTHEVINRTNEIRSLFSGETSWSAKEITLKELAAEVDEVFIALHGRPGEDGSLQKKLDELGLPYNGSGVASSQKTINKFETNALLRAKGILVAGHRMVMKSEWNSNKEALIAEIERAFPYPFIAKPADDGCSSAVKKIKNRKEMEAFAGLMFRETEEKPQHLAEVLALQPSEEFPMKSGFLIETLIEKGQAAHFLEITGGMYTRMENGKRVYEVFQPSEALASGEVLSLEEKFLAGEGQNITPARFSKDKAEQARIMAEVQKVLGQVAEILNVEGYCRIDAFVRIYEDGRVETIIIEINSLPGMTPATCIFHQAALHAMKPFDFIDSILEYGKERMATA